MAIRRSGCRPLYVTPPPSPKRGRNYVRGAYFDQAAVDHVVKALGELQHTQGRWGGTPLKPEPWQVEYIIGPIFGWKHPDGNRIVRSAWIEVPRKNGKTTLAAGLGLYLLAADREIGAQVYTAATTELQARMVFDEARRMAIRKWGKHGAAEVMASVIDIPGIGIFRVLSSDSAGAHGLNVSGGIIDEVHIHKSRDLIDAIETGTGSREQPLVIFITTADESEQTTIYSEKHDLTVRLAKRELSDPTFYGVIWAAEEGADPFSEKTWKSCNPGYGVTISAAYLKKEAKRAQNTPTYLPTFERLHLNRRRKAEREGLPMDSWDASAGMVVEEQLRGEACYGGLYTSAPIDLAAWVMVFPSEDGYDVLPRFFLPADGIVNRSQRDGVPYDVWARQGYVELTQGNVIDFGHIKAQVLKDASKFNVQFIGYDHAGIQPGLDLEDEGYGAKGMGGGYTMSQGTSELERAVMSGELRHGAHPVLRWMASNAAFKSSPDGKIKPDRNLSSSNIGGILALVMGLDQAVREQEMGPLVTVV